MAIRTLVSYTYWNVSEPKGEWHKSTVSEAIPSDSDLEYTKKKDSCGYDISYDYHPLETPLTDFSNASHGVVFKRLRHFDDIYSPQFKRATRLKEKSWDLFFKGDVGDKKIGDFNPIMNEIHPVSTPMISSEDIKFNVVHRNSFLNGPKDSLLFYIAFVARFQYTVSCFHDT